MNKGIDNSVFEAITIFDLILFIAIAFGIGFIAFEKLFGGL